MKTQKIIELMGYTAERIPANTHQTKLITYFRNVKDTIHVEYITDDAVKITTAKDSYVLRKHPQRTNLFLGVLNSIKVHFVRKKIVGKLMYWN